MSIIIHNIHIKYLPAVYLEWKISLAFSLSNNNLFSKVVDEVSDFIDIPLWNNI
jgi:hypothetical protein